MNTHRKIARIAGVLFILGTVVGILSVAPAIDDPEYLIKASTHANQIMIAAFFQCIMVVAYVGVAVSLYPMLKTYHESLALGFVGFRIIAGVFILVGVISLPLLLAVSREFVNAGAPDSSYFQTFGGLLQVGRDLVNHVAMILAVSAGGIMLYSILYQTQLVPRWLAGWGLVGTTLTIFASVLFMFRLIDVISATYLVLNLPMALQEMVLAVWLIVKGFNPSAIVLKNTRGGKA